MRSRQGQISPSHHLKVIIASGSDGLHIPSVHTQRGKGHNPHSNRHPHRDVNGMSIADKEGHRVFISRDQGIPHGCRKELRMHPSDRSGASNHVAGQEGQREPSQRQGAQVTGSFVRLSRCSREVSSKPSRTSSHHHPQPPGEGQCGDHRGVTTSSMDHQALSLVAHTVHGSCVRQADLICTSVESVIHFAHLFIWRISALQGQCLKASQAQELMVHWHLVGQGLNHQ